MNNLYKYDAAHQPVAVTEQSHEATVDWCMWLEKHRELQQDFVTLPDGRVVLVSTVFLGLDHGFRCGGPPVLWETMIFEGDLCGYQKRYTSADRALAGHAEALALVASEADDKALVQWARWTRDIGST